MSGGKFKEYSIDMNMGNAYHDAPKKDEEHLTHVIEYSAYATLKSQNAELIAALEFYANYDKQAVRDMDTEFLNPEVIAVVKPIESIGKGYAPEGNHPSEIHQDKLFTYGPKYKLGKIARELLRKIKGEVCE